MIHTHEHIAFLHAIAQRLLQVFASDLVVLRQVERHIERAADERGQRQIADGLAILKVMVRALAVGTEVAGQVERGVEIRETGSSVGRYCGFDSPMRIFCRGYGALLRSHDHHGHTHRGLSFHIR